MSMKTSYSGASGPDISKFPILTPAPRRRVVTQASSEPHPAETPAPDAHLAHTLADLVDRSTSQIVVLRSAMDEAAVTEGALRGLLGDLPTRLETLAGAARDLDGRLAAADRASAALAEADKALGDLDAAARQIRAARETLTAQIHDHIADATRRVEAALAEGRTRLERSIARHEADLAARIADLDAAYERQLDELTQVQSRAAAAARLTTDRAVEATRTAGEQAVENARQTIASLEEDIACRLQQVAIRLREQAGEAASDAVLHVAHSREADDALRQRLEQAAQVAELLDRHLAELLRRTVAPATPPAPPLRKAA